MPEDHRYNVEFYIMKASVQCSLPVDSEIIAVYGGKSAYYEQLRILQHVNVYPEMVGWLERSQLEPAQVEDTDHLWGYYKTSYMLKDLEKWLTWKQKEGEQKGKKKETVQSHSQKEKKDDGDDSGSPLPYIRSQ